MSFLEIFFATCSGVKVFQKLKDYSLTRALVHFAALAVVAAFAITFCRFYSVSSGVKKFLGLLSNEFGYVELLPDKGFLPEKLPDKERTLHVGGNFVVSYFPDKNLNLNASSEKECFGGIIWTPGVVAMWKKNPSFSELFLPSEDGPSQILALPLFRAQNTGIPLGAVGKAANVVKYLKENYRPQGPFKIKEDKYKFEDFSIILVVFILSGIFLGSIWNVLASGFLFIAIFMLMFSLMENDNLKVGFKKLYSIGLYSAFPAVFIASLFPALDLPFFDYNTVFLFCFLVYILFVINSLRKFLNKDADESDKKMKRG
jgi:hypothetical protein